MAGVQLLTKNAIPSCTHSIGRTWQAANQRAIGQTGQRSGLHGRGTDISHRYLPEQLAETIHLLVEQARHGFRRAVATSKTGATGDQHNLHNIVGDPAGNLRANFLEDIFKQNPLRQIVTGGCQAVDEDLA